MDLNRCLNELTKLLLAEENADDDYAEEKVSEDVPDSDFDVRGASERKSSIEISPLETPFSPVTPFHGPITFGGPFPHAGGRR